MHKTVKISNAQWLITAEYTKTGAVITAVGKWRGQEAGFEVYLSAEANSTHNRNSRLFFQSERKSTDYGFGGQNHRNDLADNLSVYNYSKEEDEAILWYSSHRYISSWSGVTQAQVKAVHTLIETGMALLDYNTLKDISMAKLFADSAGEIVRVMDIEKQKISNAQKSIAEQQELLNTVLKDYSDEQILFFSTLYSDGTNPLDALDIAKQM